METTRCFREQVIMKRPYLREEWIESILKNPMKMVKQENDDRIRYWGFVKELGKYLRVVTLVDGKTVHNAFPDRDFKE
ncbi:MAG: hypothetical protein COZ80_00860 [Ignavibacteria bacterium CG_4_8_14_3_um_filter_37_9]|nr:MAG: hypothetical protein AUJ54_11950 [Ignavibacteria bacterium CG1_02_37_35]PIS45788.1 MAG: hypothetical protein COT22_03455 [Ignavibacteria bacterium CG08_land_8_20_14_0_20_37_9]PIX00298.1 MAG: hypothetical protein COZ80_00860 [Ignavibacteria bacterium CG_4_8_14_3_um_filter_37_9]PIX95352.1 MAG: hypothetical protein COZ25_00895 [Ignavibacteria bacterium CG_4_10_14_3_um_filter_37_18]PJC57763.1 MAG: hypothetical protein CO025_11720 [Ignavibacteria bacterium CG_4_9_14_0_2_um_filter_37_13]